MKIVTIVGARPQFIKAAVVSRELRAQPDLFEVLVHTGQHYDKNMSAIFFDELDIPRPDEFLEIGSGSHGMMTGRMLEAIERILLRETPDWVLVYGDTNSTLAGALAAAKINIPVAHVEAGLRSFSNRMPEEINRVLTDHCAILLFAPTDTAVNHLREEGIPEARIVQTGDVMYDAVLHYAAAARVSSRVLDTLALTEKQFILATIHRAENTDDPVRLYTIMEGLSAASEIMPVVLPLHPRTHKLLAHLDSAVVFSPTLRIINPVGYLDMIRLESAAALIATDSGGVQKEAYFHHVPCVTFREVTEWTELVETGWNRLCPPISAEAIYTAILSMLSTFGQPVTLYGDGTASLRIAKCLVATS